MTWALWLLGAARNAFSALFDLVARYPWQTACIVLLCLSGWLWHGKSRAIEKYHAAQATIAAMDAASKMNLAAAWAQKIATEARYAQLAKESDDAHARELAQANDALDRYIATHRVRPDQGGVSPAPAVAQGNGAQVPADLPASAVVVSEADLRICNARTADAVAAHDWARSLIDKGLAVP